MHLTLCVVVTKIQLTCKLALMQWGSSTRRLRRLAWPRWGMMLGGFQGPRAANSLPKARPQRARRSAHAAVARSRRQESRRREYPPSNSSACSVKTCLKKDHEAFLTFSKTSKTRFYKLPAAVVSKTCSIKFS